MRFVVCHTCRLTVQVGGEELEVQALLRGSLSFPCIRPLCQGRMILTAPAKVPMGYPVRDVPIRAFFRAIHGFGAGTGAPASLARLRELLLTQRVVDLRAEAIGQPERVILREMVLESGTRLHLETSARGACVYYIEEPGPSCVEVVENELAVDAATEGGNSNREETGRAPEAQFESRVREDHRGDLSSPVGAPELSNTRGVPSVSEAGLLPSSSVSRCTEPGADTDLRV